MWKTSPAPVPYEDALAFMEARVEAIRAGAAPECIWFLEHPALFTAGVSTKEDELLVPDILPFHRVRRGGRITWHGPGQRVIYAMLDLRKRGRDVRRYVAGLENWIITALARFDIRAVRRTGRVGLWIPQTDDAPERKIAAIGVQVRHAIAFHGAAINLSPDLGWYRNIVPCGIRDYGVTSLAECGVDCTPAALDAALRASFPAIEGLQP